jgi:hypothetical protein
MSSQQRKKSGPLKGDHQIAGVRGKMKIIDTSQQNPDNQEPNNSNSKDVILSKSTKGKSRKSPGMTRKSPRTSPRTSPARTNSNRTPSPHHSHKSHKDGKISPRTAGTRGLKARGKWAQGPPAHEAKGNVGGGSRSAFADAKVNGANANTPSSMKSSNRGAPSPSSTEVSQILKSKRNSNYSQRNSYGRGSGASNNNMMIDNGNIEDGRGFELSAREKPSALMSAPKINPNIDNLQGSSRMIMSKVNRRHGRAVGRYSSNSSKGTASNVYDRNEQFLNNPFPMDNNPILPWLATSSPSKVVTMSTQTGNANSSASKKIVTGDKGFYIDGDNEATAQQMLRSEVQEKRRRASSWGPSSRRRKAKAVADAKAAAAAKERASNKNKKREVTVSSSTSTKNSNNNIKKSKNGPLSTTTSSAANQFAQKNSMNLALKEISIEEIEKLQLILSCVKEDMIRKEQERTLISGQLKEALKQHNLDDIGTDFEVFETTVEDNEGDDLEKARPRNCKSGPAALRRGQDMKQIIEAMNRIEGTPEKSFRQSFEELEEELKRNRLSGDGRTSGNAGPHAVYEIAQLKLRGLGNLTIRKPVSPTNQLQQQQQVRQEKTEDENLTHKQQQVQEHRQHIQGQRHEFDLGDDDIGARLAPNVKMFKSRESSIEETASSGVFTSFEPAGNGALMVEDFNDDTNNEVATITKSPQKLTAQPPAVPGLNLKNLKILKSPRSSTGHSNSNSPDLSKQMLDIASPRSAFSKTSARSTLTNSSTGSN